MIVIACSPFDDVVVRILQRERVGWEEDCWMEKQRILGIQSQFSVQESTHQFPGCTLYKVSSITWIDQKQESKKERKREREKERKREREREKEKERKSERVKERKWNRKERVKKKEKKEKKEKKKERKERK